jgi:pentatricopeptide repeat domain-containing protein 1
VLLAASQIAQDSAAVVSAAVLLIAVHQTSGSASDQVQAGPIANGFGVQAQAVLDMSWQLRRVLQDDTVAISGMRCLKVYLERLGCG